MCHANVRRLLFGCANVEQYSVEYPDIELAINMHSNGSFVLLSIVHNFISSRTDLVLAAATTSANELDMNSSGAWKSRIKSTIHTNTRINALLNEPKSFSTAVGQKHLLRSKENHASQDAPHRQYHRKHSTVPQIGVNENSDLTAVEHKRRELVNGVINVEHIKRMLECIVEEQIEKESFFRTYNSPISAKFCQILSREILERIKELHLDG